MVSETVEEIDNRASLFLFLKNSKEHTSYQ